MRQISYSERLVSYIKSVETLVNPCCHLPIDRQGVITGGYGETNKELVHPGMIVTPEMAEHWLRSRLNMIATLLQRVVAVPITQDQFDALADFIYNVGIGAFLESTLLKKLNHGDYHGAAAEFPRWNQVNGKELKGLTVRRGIEKEWFLSGTRSTTKTA
jgi:lysozyme